MTQYKPKTSISVKWSGNAPFVVLGVTFHPGVEQTMPWDKWVGLGASPAFCEAVASGTLAVVHKTHEFVEGETVCTGCHMTRDQVAEEREAKGRALKDAKPAPVVAPVTPTA